MVGGYSFTRSKFNRATQALRQIGSTFKPILYTAAIDRGLTPATLLVDEPTTFDAGAGQPAYAPRNYDGRFDGPLTLRTALERSRNIPAVKVMEMLGPGQVVPYAARFGLPGSLPPFLSSALGAGESTLIALTSAYSAFPNHGVRMEPVQVLSVADREGVLLEEHAPVPRDAIRADTAYVMTSMLRGVVQRGTAASAASLDWPLARQDRHGGRLHRRLVRRLRPRRDRRGLARLRREEADRQRRDRHHRGAADLDRDHARLPRGSRSRGAADLRRRPATSSSCRSTATPASRSTTARHRPSPKRSSPAPSRAARPGCPAALRRRRRPPPPGRACRPPCASGRS